MCYLETKLGDNETRGGWKVVAVDKRTGDYYSPATGLNYSKRKTDELPRKKTAKRIGHHFNSNLLKNAYNEDMQGKSAIFVEWGDAEALASDVAFCLLPEDRVRYIVQVVHAEVYGEVWYGRYGAAPVYAGNHLRFVDPPGRFLDWDGRGKKDAR